MTTKEKIIGDCMEELPIIDKVHGVGRLWDFNLVVTDPPYNIGWKYSDKVNDKRNNYFDWCSDWIDKCIDSLRENGIICIINYPENNNILYKIMIDKGLTFIQQLIWCYPTNVGQSKRKYTRSYRTILVFSNGKDYTFNPHKQQYKNPNDKRIKERIKNGFLPNHYDIFEFNLCKNVSKSKKNNGINQLPNDLVEMLIRTYSNEEDNILDPFSGNDTVIEMAYKLKRNCVGIDINRYDQNV